MYVHHRLLSDVLRPNILVSMLKLRFLMNVKKFFFLVSDRHDNKLYSILCSKGLKCAVETRHYVDARAEDEVGYGRLPGVDFIPECNILFFVILKSTHLFIHCCLY